MTDLRILAFDLGQHMAWSANYIPGNSAFGITGYCTAHVDLEGKERPAKLAHLQALLAALEGSFDVVVYERPFARGQGATRMLWGVAAMLEAYAAAKSIPVIDYSPGEIKKWATGRGDAEKADMIAAAQFMGYNGENEHEADAFCLLQFAASDLERDKKCRISSTIQASRRGARKLKSATSKLRLKQAATPARRASSASTARRSAKASVA